MFLVEGVEGDYWIKENLSCEIGILFFLPFSLLLERTY